MTVDPNAIIGPRSDRILKPPLDPRWRSSSSPTTGGHGGPISPDYGPHDTGRISRTLASSDGTQRVEDTGPLTKKRRETVD